MTKNDLLSKPICPKCQGDMESGQLMRSNFINFISDSERKKVIGKSIRVTAYRCQRCGYCEIYAKGSA